MGSGYWFKTIISRKRIKNDRTKQHEGATSKGKGSKWMCCSSKEPNSFSSRKNFQSSDLTEKDAARRIQTAFRAYMARKTLQRMKGIVRVRGVIEGDAVRNQASSALNHIHFWSKIQVEIRDRWLHMVSEARIKQKKLENQLKLEAKLHELEVEWCGGSETMEEILSRIQQREEAAVKRERAMAYAFSHQWRASSGQHFGQAYYDLGKESWGWSWKERWIAVRPWENRVQPKSSIIPKKMDTKQKTSKTTSPASAKLIVSAKPILSNGKDSSHARKSSSHNEKYKPSLH